MRGDSQVQATEATGREQGTENDAQMARDMCMDVKGGRYMSIKPILFSTPMVQAILDGRKTMTRRVVKPQPTNGIRPCGYALYGWSETKENGDCYCHNPGWSPYRVDDVLWVRETWAKFCINKKTCRNCILSHSDYCYKASPDCVDLFPCKWHPSIFMPREACRLYLRVTDVRAERLQDITPDDIWAEGTPGIIPYDAWQTLWDSINAKRGYGWDANPWVWVYTFERVEKPDSTRTVAKYATHGEFIPDKEG